MPRFYLILPHGLLKLAASMFCSGPRWCRPGGLHSCLMTKWSLVQIPLPPITFLEPAIVIYWEPLHSEKPLKNKGMLSRSHTTEGIHKHSKRPKNSTELLVNKQGSKEKLNFRNRVIQLKNKNSAKKRISCCVSLFFGMILRSSRSTI